MSQLVPCHLFYWLSMVRVEKLAIHGPVRDQCLSDLSEGHDLNSGCSVKTTLLLHIAVVIATETRPPQHYPFKSISAVLSL